MSVTDYRLRPRRVGAVGGSRIGAMNAAFCDALGYALAQEQGLVIVTGGRRGMDVPAADESVIAGARRYLAEHGIEELSRLETLVPRGEFSGLFRAGKTQEIKNVTRQSRRFALVRYVDVLVTIEGEHGTPQMVDLALEFEKPVLPLAFTGGKSREQWEAHRDVIKTRLGIVEEDCRALERPLEAANIPAIAALVKRLVVRALKRRCFVAMPFGPEFDEIYNTAAEALGDLNLIPVRTDHLNLTGDVLDIIRESIAACECALTVITGENANVMYELGLVHALDKPTMLLCEWTTEGSLPRLPFDLRTQDVVGYCRSDLARLRNDIRAKLAMVVPIQ